jgi:hypothetical protein
MKFLQDSLDLMRLSIQEQLKRQNIAELAQQVHHHIEGEMPLWLMRLSEEILGIVLKIIPDFSRFDAWNNFLRGYTISISSYSYLIEYIFIYAIVMLVISIIAFRLREIK